MNEDKGKLVAEEEGTKGAYVSQRGRHIRSHNRGSCCWLLELPQCSKPKKNKELPLLPPTLPSLVIPFYFSFQKREREKIKTRLAALWLS